MRFKIQIRREQNIENIPRNLRLRSLPLLSIFHFLFFYFTGNLQSLAMPWQSNITITHSGEVTFQQSKKRHCLHNLHTQYRWRKPFLNKSNNNNTRFVYDVIWFTQWIMYSAGYELLKIRKWLRQQQHAFMLLK